jgi:phosphatidylglycerol:prolipoprotein diacylglycerol transferase
MIQELFHIGSFSISPFGVMMVLAFLAAYRQLSWGLKRTGAGDADDASALLFAGGFGGIAGAKIYYAVLYHDWHLLFDRSGLVWYGGFVLGGLAVLWTMRHRGLRGWLTADAAAPALALGYAVGRIGCFLVGDDYGIPTRLPWGVAFPVGLPPTTAGNLRQVFGLSIPLDVAPDQLVRVHPTQLYETALGLLICGVGIWWLRRRPKPGVVALGILALLAIERFGIEFLRAKDDRFFGELTLAQVISLVVLLVVALIAWWRRGRPAAGRESPSEAP